MVLIEDHHQALEVWRKEGFQNLPLVHLDAHIDFAFYHARPPEQVMREARSVKELKRQLETTLLYQKYRKDYEKQLNIGNYIYPAMREGIITDFYWIIPGDANEFKKRTRLIARQIKFLQARDPFKSATTLLYKHPFKIASLYRLPAIRHPLLLDIDVDFLLFDSLARTSLRKRIGKRRPWLSPQELAALVKKKFPRAVFTTIAYSVNGGFTPLEYKFFGDEIYLRLKGPLDSTLEAIFSLRDRGMDQFFRGDFSAAAADFEKALDAKLNPRFRAHLHFWLYKILWQAKQKEKARFHYQKALENDASYRIKDNNFGPLYLSKGRLGPAQNEFKKILFCDPLDHFARYGQGMVFFQKRKYKEALTYFKKALSLFPGNNEARLKIAACHFLQKKYAVAKKLFLALDNKLWLARLYKRLGRFNACLSYYKEASLLNRLEIEDYESVFKILKNGLRSEEAGFFLHKYRGARKFFLRGKNAERVRALDRRVLYERS